MQPHAQPSSLKVNKGSADRAREAVSLALSAPSSHNSQPWLFSFTLDGIELIADRARALPVVDPGDRELVISCGAVLHHLEVALSALGEGHRVTLLPDDTDPDLLASVSLLGPIQPTPLDLRRREAMAKRRTTRFAFSPRSPEPVALSALVHACGTRASFHVVEGSNRTTLGFLIAESDRYQFAQPSFRAELAQWLRTDVPTNSDGMPGYSLGLGDFAARVAPLVVRTFDRGDGQAAADNELVEGSPVLGIIATADDTVASRLNAGRALSATLLEATLLGISASFLNQPIEVPELREQVRRLLPDGLCPQLVLRMGYYDGQPLRATPRRGLDEVVLRHRSPLV
jgi:nitroreductase